MLAPYEKQQRGGNDTIQICVTHGCDLACSNCTQLLPFRRDARFMSVDCFREAVQSLDGWPGIVGVFGGNPCVHPRFADLCGILAEYVPAERRGLWTNNLFRHGEIAAATFGRGRTNLNAHGDEAAAAQMRRWFPDRVVHVRNSMHAPVMFDRRDVGISDEDWTAARERCDVNQRWSGAIAERDGKPYGYFCEVAAALDGVRGENHGVPAVPGWWRQGMDAFGQQVSGCCDRGCGVPLRGLGHLDRNDTYDVTDAWVPLTIGRKATALVHTTLLATEAEATDYQRLRQ